MFGSKGSWLGLLCAVLYIASEVRTLWRDRNKYVIIIIIIIVVVVVVAVVDMYISEIAVVSLCREPAGQGVTLGGTYGGKCSELRNCFMHWAGQGQARAENLSSSCGCCDSYPMHQNQWPRRGHDCHASWSVDITAASWTDETRARPRRPLRLWCDASIIAWITTWTHAVAESAASLWNDVRITRIKALMD